MKSLLTIVTLLLLLLSVSLASAQTFNPSDLESLREERAVYLFNKNNAHDIAKQKEMVQFSVVSEKADLDNKRREIQIVNDESFPKMVEMNNVQKAAWEYEQAKKAWVSANRQKYENMMSGTSTN